MNGSGSVGLSGLPVPAVPHARARSCSPPPPALPRRACTPAVPCLPMPTLQEQRSNCPFQQSGLKRWDDPSTWGGRVPSVSSLSLAPTDQPCIWDEWACAVRRAAAALHHAATPPSSCLCL